MAISFNDNIKILAPKPLDQRYLNSDNIPYSATTEVNSTILVSERYIGLIVNINNVEYWYETGTADLDLVIKTAPPSADTYVSGATLNGSVLELQRTEGEADVTVDLSGLTELSDKYVTGATYGGSILSLQRSQGLPDVTVSIGVSGVTDGVVSGGTLSGATLVLQRTIGLSDVNIDLSALSGGTGTGGQPYTGDTPSNITVGGIPAGTELSGKTLSQLMQDILITTLNPAIVAPNNTLAENVTNIQEVGVVIPNIIVSATFTRGTITPQYDATGTEIAPSAPRSGLPNNYNYTGAQIAGSYPSASLSDNQTVTGYTLLLGSNTWGGTVSYDASAIIAYDSSGGIFSPALVAGTTGNKSVTLTGQYLRFYGPASATPTTSGQVRALPSSAFQTSNVNVFSLNTGAALTKFVVALPPSRTISNVIDIDALNANITSQYVLQGTINVNDGGGTGSVQVYNLYEMNVGSPYATSHNHQITTA